MRARTWRCSTNVVDAVEPVAPSLEHISLMQGYKVYGAHLGPFATPAKEPDPPHMPPEFNVDQQQFLERRQGGCVLVAGRRSARRWSPASAWGTR